MIQNTTNAEVPIAAWHRNLLALAAVFTVLLIAMGGVLCVTQSIRSCPDWPGCFGKLIPPLETSPILEFTHRLLAAGSGLLVFAAAIAGLARSRRLRWIVIPPLVASILVVEVSYFGAMVVLRGITPGWAAVDVGSALLVVAFNGNGCCDRPCPQVPSCLLRPVIISQPICEARSGYRRRSVWSVGERCAGGGKEFHDGLPGLADLQSAAFSN